MSDYPAKIILTFEDFYPAEVTGRKAEPHYIEITGLNSEEARTILRRLRSGDFKSKARVSIDMPLERRDR